MEQQNKYRVIVSARAAQMLVSHAAFLAQVSPAAAVPTAPPTGADGYSAERLALSQACHTQPRAQLVAKGPGFETYSLACSNGDALAIRCEFGNCRVLR